MTDEENTEEREAYYYIQEPLTATDTKHHYYLYGQIQSPEKYPPLIHHLLTSPENDEVNVHLNTQGGSLEGGAAILNGFNACQSKVIAHLEAQAFSMGTILFLAADDWVVHDNTMLMFHHYTGESWGKGNELVAHVNAQEKWHREITAKLYVPFLDQNEYDRMLDGADFWFHPEEIRERLEKVKSLRNENN